LIYWPRRDSERPFTDIDDIDIDPDAKKMWRIAGLTGAVGIEIAVAIAIGALGGQWLDRKAGTSPWFTIIGFAAGVGAAIKALIRITRDYRKRFATDSGPSTPAPQDDKPAMDDEPDAR
jgi:F0F1-type ATP synthase assembly protein I